MQSRTSGAPISVRRPEALRYRRRFLAFRFLPLSLLIGLVALLWGFRSWRAFGVAVLGSTAATLLILGWLAASGGSMLSAQMSAGVATAFVTPELAADEGNLRHNVVECLGFLLVNYRDRTPVHAAAVVRNGRAVLFMGQSTAGKSTLCYACVRAGFASPARSPTIRRTSRACSRSGGPT